MLESFQKRALNIGIKCRSQYTHSDVYVGRGREGKRTATKYTVYPVYLLPPNSLLSVDGLIKLRMQRVFIGALCRQMSSCNQLERDSIFGRDSYERKLSNHHDQMPRQGATAIIEFFSVTHTSKNFEGARGACVRQRGAPVPWHNGTMASPSLSPSLTCASVTKQFNLVPANRR